MGLAESGCNGIPYVGCNGLVVCGCSGAVKGAGIGVVAFLVAMAAKGSSKAGVDAEVGEVAKGL